MIHKIAIVGMGALGLLYADQLTSGLGDPGAVEFVMDEERLKRHKEDTYTINGTEKHFKMINANDAEPADLVLVAVKYNALSKALDTMTNCIGADTIILSVMNGVTSEEIIAGRYGMEHMIYCVAQGMDAMRDGTTLKYTQCGKLHIGAVNPDMQKRADAVRELFDRAGLPYLMEEDILHRMWFKYMLNVGVNQACTVFDTTYGVVTTPGETAYEKMFGAMLEVIPVAKAHGVELTEEDAMTCIEIERTLDPKGYPSMTQDLKAGRKTEVRMFAGEMIRMAGELGIKVPYNQFMYDRMMEIEKNLA